MNHPAETHEEDQGHYETVVIEEAWDEPVYDTHCVCNQCGFDSGKDTEAMGNHLLDSETCYNYSAVDVQVDTIHHPEVTEEQWISNIVTVVDKEAWSEQVLTGFICSVCGASKGA